MNITVIKEQIKQIIVSEVAKYYHKACTPAGLSLEDLRCLEIIAKMSDFEQDLRDVEPNEKVAEETSVAELLKIVRMAQSNDPKP